MPIIDNWGNSAGFHAARQDAQLPRLTVHWLSVTRATEGPLSKSVAPTLASPPPLKDIGASIPWTALTSEGRS
jgi:hypothetical protein